MTGGLAFVVRILGHEHTGSISLDAVILPELGRGGARTAVDRSEVIVLRFCCCPFVARTAPGGRQQFVLTRALRAPKTTFAMMLEERIIPLI